MDISLNISLCILSFISGFTNQRLKRKGKLIPIVFFVLLGFCQGLVFRHYKISRKTLIIQGVLLLFFNVLGKALQMIGLTGGISCGKSSVVAVIRENFKSYGVIDCDFIARDIMRPGKNAYNKVVKAFGKEILLPDGNINREALGNMIFSNPSSRKTLDRITMPIIFFEIFKELFKHRIKGKRHVILDAPLLFESKVLVYFCCPIITVFISDKDLWVKRLCQRDHITESQAKNKITSQMAIEKKIIMSDILVENSGSISQLENTVKDIIRQID